MTAPPPSPSFGPRERWTVQSREAISFFGNKLINSTIFEMEVINCAAQSKVASAEGLIEGKPVDFFQKYAEINKFSIDFRCNI